MQSLVCVHTLNFGVKVGKKTHPAGIGHGHSLWWWKRPFWQTTHQTASFQNRQRWWLLQSTGPCLASLVAISQSHVSIVLLNTDKIILCPPRSLSLTKNRTNSTIISTVSFKAVFGNGDTLTSVHSFPQKREMSPLGILPSSFTLLWKLILWSDCTHKKPL